MASVRMIAMQNENIYSFFCSIHIHRSKYSKKKNTRHNPHQPMTVASNRVYIYHITHVLWWKRMHQFCCVFIKTYRNIQYLSLSLSLPFSGSSKCFYFWCVNEHENNGMGRRYARMRQVAPILCSEPPVSSHTHTRTKRNNATRKNIIILFIIQFNIHKVPWDWKHLFSLSSLSFFFVNAMAVNTPPFTQSHSHAKRAPF